MNRAHKMLDYAYHSLDLWDALVLSGFGQAERNGTHTRATLERSPITLW